MNESDRSSPSALYSYASRASSRYRDGSRLSRREAEDVEARLRALGWRGGGASSKRKRRRPCARTFEGRSRDATEARRGSLGGGALRAYHGSFRGGGETKE